MTLQSFADIESNNNLADPEVRTTPVSNVSSLCCSGYFHSLEYLKIRYIALNDLSAVCSASVSVLASTDNLTLAERVAM